MGVLQSVYLLVETGLGRMWGCWVWEYYSLCTYLWRQGLGQYVGVLGVGVLQSVYLLVETGLGRMWGSGCGSITVCVAYLWRPGEAGSFLRISSKITNSTRGYEHARTARTN